MCIVLVKTKAIIGIPVADPNSFFLLKSIVGAPPSLFQWGIITNDGKWISVNGTQDSYRVVNLKTDQFKMQRVLFPLGTCTGCKIMNVFWDSDKEDLLAVFAEVRSNRYYIGHITIKNGKVELLMELPIPLPGYHMPVGVVEVGKSEFLLSFSYATDPRAFVAVMRFKAD